MLFHSNTFNVYMIDASHGDEGLEYRITTQNNSSVSVIVSSRSRSLLLVGISHYIL